MMITLVTGLIFYLRAIFWAKNTFLKLASKCVVRFWQKSGGSKFNLGSQKRDESKSSFGSQEEDRHDSAGLAM